MWKKLIDMRSRETLGNQTFSDITAWRGVRNAERNNIVEFHTPVEQFKPVNRIAELNQELRMFNAFSNNPNLNPQERSQCKLLQQQRRSELFEEMVKSGHKPIRTKKLGRSGGPERSRIRSS